MQLRDSLDSIEPEVTPRVALVFALVCLVLVALGIAVWPHPPPTAAVRVRNISSVTLQDLSVGRGHYGSVGPGVTSPYQTWGPVYETSGVSFKVGDQQLGFVPEDHYNEHPISPVSVTFEIDVTGEAPQFQFTTKVVRE